MKLLKVFSVLFFMSLLGLQSLNAQDWGDFSNFFQSRKSMPYRAISQLYAPNNEYINGSVGTVLFPEGSDKKIFDLTVNIFCDDGRFMVRLHLNKTTFDKIEIINSTDWVAPFVLNDVLKAFAESMIKSFKKDEITWIENKYGKRLYDMSREELCLASLTLQYWKNDWW